MILFFVCVLTRLVNTLRTLELIDHPRVAAKGHTQALGGLQCTKCAQSRVHFHCYTNSFAASDTAMENDFSEGSSIDLPAAAWMAIAQHSDRVTRGQLRRSSAECRSTVDASTTKLCIQAWPLDDGVELLLSRKSAFSALKELAFTSDKP